MKTYSVVTTFNQKGYDSYANKMIASFDANWPKDIQLHVLCENVKIDQPISERIKEYDLLTLSPELCELKNKWKDLPKANGYKNNIKIGEPNFRYNPLRFSHKLFSVFEANKIVDSDILIWIDADVITFREMPYEFLEEVTPNINQIASYIGREPYFVTECGWVAYNRRHSEIENFFDTLKSFYINESIFNLYDWTDNGVFDKSRQIYEHKGFDFFNISKNVLPKGDHYFINSPLGKYLDHLKGEKRKSKGSSNKKDIHSINVNLEYWKNLLK